MNKEQIYDEQISPLMLQIIKICRENKIANVCSFGLGDNKKCDTIMTTEEFEPTEALKLCSSVLRRNITECE